MAEGTVHVGEGVELFYRVSGTGGDVVLIPNGFHFERELAPLAGTRRLVFYDVRNRGRSSAVRDDAALAGGIRNDVDDLERMRRYFDADQIDLIGHSYIGVVLMLYAAAHPHAVRRLVAIGPLGPRPAARYEPPLSCSDGTVETVMTELGGLQQVREQHSAEEFCRLFWAILGRVYVVDPADAARAAAWGRCDLPNERAAMSYWTRFLLPSLNAVNVTREDVEGVAAPVLIVHGLKDRSAPIGGGRDWARMLPDARLLAIDNGGHGPWIEAPDLVIGAIERFFGGDWPPQASLVAPEPTVSS